MSVHSHRHALTRERGLPPGVQSISGGLVTIYPYDRCRSSTIATIIQHSAENLHENSHRESRVASGKNGLSHGIPQFSFFFLRNSIRHLFANVHQANQFCSKGHPRCGMNIFQPSQADLSDLPSVPQKKIENVQKNWHVLAEPICW
jgi:hypothetical protein